MAIKALSVVGLAVMLSACAGNPYNKFYDGQADARALPGYVAPSAPARLIATSKDAYAQRNLDLLRQGYAYLGQASFSGGGRVSEAEMIEQAQKVGAHIVLHNREYSHSTQGAMPLTLPNNQTSVSTARATAYGPGGVVNAYGSGTTTTYGTQTTMIPFSVDHSNFVAAFYAKTKPKLGVYVQALNDQQRAALQSNTGLAVEIVVEDSPAFLADILPGDVLLAVNGRPMTSRDSFNAALEAAPPMSTAVVKLSRKGAVLEKQIALAR